MDHSPIHRPTWRQVLLGLFVCWQLVYVLSYNIVQLYPQQVPSQDDELSDSRSAGLFKALPTPLSEVVQIVADVDRKWSYLTGQVQAWYLFAPDYPHQATFPVVEILGPGFEKPVRLLSSVEPADASFYFRFSPGVDRLFHYEVRLGLLFSAYTPELFELMPEDWRDEAIRRVQRQWKSIHAYLSWRLGQYWIEHPNGPAPAEVRLHIRVFPTPGLGAARQWGDPWEVPFARERITEKPSDAYLPVEAYDLIKKEFVLLPKKKD